MEFPLARLRVLDLSRVVAGPMAGRMLCDLGADVVKLEPPSGDVSRVWGEVRNDLSGFYTQQNAGKRNICVDLTAGGGPDTVRALAEVADVMIENFRPGVLRRFGLGWDELHAANPALILLSISGFGQRGASAGRAAYAPIVHAESGLVYREATEYGRAATDPVLSIADTTAALHGTVAVLAALHLRERTGEGQWIDLPMIEAMLATDDYAHHALDASPVVRLGGEVWSLGDGDVMIAGNFRNTWRVLSTVYGIADPTPEGADLDTKIALRRRAVAEWLRSFDTRDAVVAVLEHAGLAWGAVRSSPEAFEEYRGWDEVDDRGGGTRRVVRMPYRFSDAATGVRGSAPHRGEHNAEVLSEWLGWPAERIDALAAAGVLR